MLIYLFNYRSLDLLDKMWSYLKLVRIYTKPKGQLPDYESPVVLQTNHCTIEDFCNKIHRTIIKEYDYNFNFVKQKFCLGSSMLLSGGPL